MFYPLITVIVPNYNHKRFLEQRINSILDQTYTNIEIIILDDCSTDNSCEIIERYRNNPYVSQIIYNTQNSGSTFKQWQKGINLAKGDYIWIAESDDYCDDKFLCTLISGLEKYPNTAMIYSDIILVDKTGNIMNEKTKGHCHNIPSTKNIYNGIDFIKERMLRNCSVCNASSVLFKREIANTISLNYTNLKSAGDYLFWILIAEKGNVIKINKGLDYFRQHNTNVTTSSYKNGITQIEEFYIHKYLCNKKILTGKERLKIYLEKLEKIKYDNNIAPSIKRKILQKWDKFHLFNKWFMTILWKFLK